MYNKNYREELEQIINYQGISKKKLDSPMIYQYQIIAQLLYELFCRIQIQGEQVIRQLIKQTIRIVKINNRSLNISLVLKKIFFLQLFIRIISKNNKWSEKVVQILSKELSQIVRQDLVLILKKKGKISSSLQKIASFIRDLSSTQSSDKIKLQQLDETLKDTVAHIMLPYCNYLMKIINANDIYSSILRKQEQVFNNQFVWKMINWSLFLSKIIKQLNKIGKYFKGHFQAVWVFFSYMISQDIGKYYSILREKAEKQSNKWLDRLLLTKKFYKINKNSNLFRAEQLKQLVNLKAQIDEVNIIKQDLNFLYYNKKLAQWRDVLYPLSIKEQIRKSTASEQLLNIIGTLTKYKQFSFIADLPHKQGALQGQSVVNFTQATEGSISLATTQSEQGIRRERDGVEKQVQIRRNVFTQKRVRVTGRK